MTPSRCQEARRRYYSLSLFQVKHKVALERQKRSCDKPISYEMIHSYGIMILPWMPATNTEQRDHGSKTALLIYVRN